ncbi:MAG: hypothetical protein IT381_29580 [Deltaproteobacteria bacterium]|nr:hypothetical protein [Deltaproteobacteria bacterium]
MTFEGCFLSGVTTGGGPTSPEVPAEPTDTASEDNAHFMQWDTYSTNQTWLRTRIAALAHIRQQHSALRRGTRQTLGTTGDVLAYAMSAPGDDLVVILNRGDDSETAPGVPAGSYVDLVSGAAVSTPVDVAARTGMILRAQ